MSLLSLADGIAVQDSGTIRVVTFQDSSVVKELLSKGGIQTLLKSNQEMPKKFSRVRNKPEFFLANGERVVKCVADYSQLEYEIVSGNKIERIMPFYTYHKHRYCDEMRNMSIYTIYGLASHFMASCGYEGRSIIELDVPVKDIAHRIETDDLIECILTEIKKDWVVSVLSFSKFVTEPIHGENALLYRNEVYKEDTYRMCYSDTIVFNGHGKGDNVECCMSPFLFKKYGISEIQRDYVQPALWKLFAKYAYTVRHGLPVEEAVLVEEAVAINDMPDEFDNTLMFSFELKGRKLTKWSNIKIYSPHVSWKERLEAANKSILNMGLY